MIQVSERFNGNSSAETYYLICCLEVDGLFTDFPDETYQISVLTFKNPSICSDICPPKFISINKNQTYNEICSKQVYFNTNFVFFFIGLAFLSGSSLTILCKKIRRRNEGSSYDDTFIGQTYSIVPKQ
jgi:hypothetical protein